MKKIPLVVLVSLIAISCSAPKYTYYFDRVKTSPPQVASAETSIAPVNPEELVASTGTAPYEVVTPVVKEEGATDAKRSIQGDNMTSRKNLRAKIQETRAFLKDDATKSPATTKATKGSKETLAVIGFVFSIVGWFLPIAVGAAVLVGAAILCVVGLKGERRKLSLAGLIISLVGLVILIAYSASN